MYILPFKSLWSPRQFHVFHELLFIKWVAKWIENIVKTLTRLEIIIFIWNNNFVLQTFAFVKEFSICSNYSLADLWHSSCQFVEVIWRNFTPRFLKHLTQPQTITLPPPCLTDGVRHSSSIFSLVLRLTNVLLCDPNTSNLDLSVHNTFFQSSSV